MGNRRVERIRLVKKEKGIAAPPAGEVKGRSVLEEKLYCTRLELQKNIALSADADEMLCRLATAARRLAKERDEACMRRNALLAAVHARRSAQAMMAAALASRSPAAAFAASSWYGNRAFVVPAPFVRVRTQEPPSPAAFSCYGNRALAPFVRVTTPQEQYYARAAGVSYCFASSSSRTPGQDSFDPDMFLVDAGEGGSVGPAAATGSAPGMAGKRKRSSGSELRLVTEQMLRLPPKKRELLKAPVHEEEDDGSSGEETVSDAGSTEAGDSVDKKEKRRGGGGCSLADVVGTARKKQK